MCHRRPQAPRRFYNRGLDTLTVMLAGALVPPDWARDPDWEARVQAPPAARRLARSGAHEPRSGEPEPALPARALPHEHWLARKAGLADGAAWHAGSAHADGVADAAWRLDPVSLQVAMNHVSLAALPARDLPAADARALADSVAGLLADDGLALRVAPSGRWYLAAGRPLRLTTGTPLAALGRSVESYLPTGRDALRWRRLVTEIEMTWHDHPVNAAREQARLAPINSVWLTGPVPAAPVAPAAGLVVEERLLQPRLSSDPAAWADAWEAIASTTLSDALAALDASRCGALDVVATGETQVRTCRIERGGRWRFWRRLRPASLVAQWTEET